MMFLCSLDRILGPKGTNGFVGGSPRDEGTVQTNRDDSFTHVYLKSFRIRTVIYGREKKEQKDRPSGKLLVLTARKRHLT
jgi:hypothetical protein